MKAMVKNQMQFIECQEGHISSDKTVIYLRLWEIVLIKRVSTVYIFWLYLKIKIGVFYIMPDSKNCC